MADEIPSPTEYDRPPVYQRPLGGIVRVMERLLNLGMTQAEAIKPES
jgi:hypothetical protein